MSSNRPKYTNQYGTEIDVFAQREHGISFEDMLHEVDKLTQSTIAELPGAARQTMCVDNFDGPWESMYAANWTVHEIAGQIIRQVFDSAPPEVMMYVMLSLDNTFLRYTNWADIPENEAYRERVSGTMSDIEDEFGNAHEPAYFDGYEPVGMPKTFRSVGLDGEVLNPDLYEDEEYDEEDYVLDFDDDSADILSDLGSVLFGDD